MIASRRCTIGTRLLKPANATVAATDASTQRDGQCTQPRGARIKVVACAIVTAVAMPAVCQTAPRRAGNRQSGRSGKRGPGRLDFGGVSHIDKTTILQVT